MLSLFRKWKRKRNHNWINFQWKRKQALRTLKPLNLSIYHLIKNQKREIIRNFKGNWSNSTKKPLPFKSKKSLLWLRKVHMLRKKTKNKNLLHFQMTWRRLFRKTQPKKSQDEWTKINYSNNLRLSKNPSKKVNKIWTMSTCRLKPHCISKS